MKSIELTSAKETIQDREVDLNTKELIKMVLNHPPEKGFDVSEMKNRMRVLDALEAVNGSTVLNLEDADFALLSTCVKAMRWGVLSKSVLDFAANFD